MITLSRAPATLPQGRRIYAIGDIHGCNEQLGNLHDIIAEDLARRPVDTPLVLHIGDYVDRGIDTAGVLRRLLAGSPIAGVPVVNLLGNHDDTMLHALSGDRPAATDWLFTGGRPALESYDIDPGLAARNLAGRRAAGASRLPAQPQDDLSGWRVFLCPRWRTSWRSPGAAIA